MSFDLISLGFHSNEQVGKIDSKAKRGGNSKIKSLMLTLCSKSDYSLFYRLLCMCGTDVKVYVLETNWTFIEVFLCLNEDFWLLIV